MTGRRRRRSSIPFTKFVYSAGDALPTGSTYTRSGPATYVDSNGIVQTAAINTLRDSHYIGGVRGVLLEAARTNALTYSEQFDNGAWTKAAVSVTANAVNGPDGTLSADKIVSTADGGYRVFFQSAAATASVAHTATIYAKAAEQSEITMELRYAGEGEVITASFTLTGAGVAVVANPTGSPLVSIEALANGWYRCNTTKTNPGAGTTCLLIVKPGGTVVNGEGVYFWGAQFELGAFPSSYIPTAASTLTRGADFFKLPFRGTPQNMTSYVKMTDLGTAQLSLTWLFNLGANNSQYRVLTPTGDYRTRHFNGSSDIESATGPLAAPFGSTVEHRGVLNTNGSVLSAASVNGAVEVVGSISAANTMGTTFTPQELVVNSFVDGTSPGFASFQSIKFNIGTKTLAEMQALT